MKARYKQQWLAALRSGEFLQCRGAMRLVDAQCHERFCLLGVLAEIVRRENPDKYVWTFSCVGDDGEAVYNFRPVGGGLPTGDWWHEIEKKLGVCLLENTKIDFLGDELSIPELNDDFGVGFEEAAELIEAQM